MNAPTPEAGWRSFESCTRKQLLTTCYALEDTRDRAIERADNAEERIEKARAACVSLGHLAQGVLSALDGDPVKRLGTGNGGQPPEPSPVIVSHERGQGS